MSRELSFRQRVDAGWTKEQLMDHYAMTNTQYEKVIANLVGIKIWGRT